MDANKLATLYLRAAAVNHRAGAVLVRLAVKVLWTCKAGTLGVR